MLNGCSRSGLAMCCDQLAIDGKAIAEGDIWVDMMFHFS